jgi:alginate O-acetyltransferase complex protein AlgI
MGTQAQRRCASGGWARQQARNDQVKHSDMLFNSLSFVIFFSIVLVLHYLPFPWRLKKFNLLIASYLFYAAWNPPLVILIWFSTLLDWYVVKGLGRYEGKSIRRALLLISMIGNLGLLGFFKYGGFVLDNFVLLVNAAGLDYQPAMPSIILPVGISFYTFQTMSYTLDVYKGHGKPWRSFLDYALYVTFFPQLVAGPIVRAADFLPQCVTPRKANATQFSWGLSLFIIGLFEKVVVADGLLAPIADKVFADALYVGTLDAWIGTLAFSGQIFCDFAGYSTCAIGVAMCLGFGIQDNFRFPYAAIGFSDFWRRWHISLSSWLRDYLYISLGGNRKGDVRTYVNLFLTMLLGGLWHGAAWTFVFWGALHGFYLIVERRLKEFVKPSPFWSRFPVRIALALVTYACVCFAWVFFRAQNFVAAGSILSSMVGFNPENVYRAVKINESAMVLGITVLMLGLHGYMRDTTVEYEAARLPWFLRGAILAAMLIAILTMAGDDRAFIYFQF